MFSLPHESLINSTQLSAMSSTILYQIENHGCTQNSTDDAQISEKATTLEVWGYSLLCVTIINICSLMGLVFLPLMKKDYYSRLLMYMVALAVGTLAGSSILFLIPEVRIEYFPR